MSVHATARIPPIVVYAVMTAPPMTTAIQYGVSPPLSASNATPNAINCARRKLVSAATKNAVSNNLPNVSFRLANLDEIDGNEAWIKEGWDHVLLDPARNGAAEVVQHMGGIAAKRIVYVSCHPGTLARDAGTLVNEQGYRLEAAGIIDMFPHTAHVESIAVFSKK